MTIKMGSRGPDVKCMQLKLKAAGYSPGDIDGIFGKLTLAALTRFQQAYDQIADTGEYDVETAAALDQALAIRDGESPAPVDPPPPTPCDATIWAAFQELVKLVTSAPVRYGPGRGLFKDGKFIITYGPGGLGITTKGFPNHLGKTYPAFHCTSWTNFFLGWLLRYNEDYTHAGNIPSLFTLLEASRDVHTQAGASSYRGYSPYVQEIVSTGATATRTKFDAKVMDVRELYDRRATLPTFLVCGQSTHTTSGWKTWHHTVLYVIDHRSAGSPLYRIAADGYRDAAGYSSNAMKWIEINQESFQWFDNAIYRVYGVISPDGKYGGDRPIAKVELEPC